jgi:hypothetical protein
MKRNTVIGIIITALIAALTALAAYLQSDAGTAEPAAVMAPAE